MFKSRRLVVISFSVLMVFGAACKKKPHVLPPPPPDTRGQVTPTNPDLNARPSVLAFSVEPSTIQAGQSATLRWNVTGANSVSIDQGVGQQSSTGTRQVSPNNSTTYTLTATGTNGQSTATTTLTVTSAPAPPPTTTPNLSIEEMISRQVQDIYFDYDLPEVSGRLSDRRRALRRARFRGVQPGPGGQALLIDARLPGAAGSAG
jgi:peptidoglycan-associated lipoprotein